MDSSNRRYLENIHKDNLNKYKPLLERDVSDPWCTRDFETCYSDILRGILNIIKEIKED